MPVYRFTLVTIINGIFLVTVVIATNGIDNSILMRLIGAAISLLFLILGNYLSAIRPNYFVGIRTPWTLENEDVWKATHRTAGRIWVATGAVLFALSIFLPWQIFQFFLIIGIIVMVVYPVMHSFLLFKRLV